MTHASVPPAMRHAMGLTDSLIRLSCGVEDPDDLIQDLDRAMGACVRER
jgi:cystathionine beta-lyase/cystathionine gamma-synthase